MPGCRGASSGSRGGDRRCQDPGARGLGGFLGGGGGGGGVATRKTGPYMYIYICTPASAQTAVFE